MPSRVRWQCPQCGTRYEIPAGHDPDLCPRCLPPAPEFPAPEFPAPDFAAEIRRRTRTSAVHIICWIASSLICLTVISYAFNDKLDKRTSDFHTLLVGLPLAAVFASVCIAILVLPPVVVFKHGRSLIKSAMLSATVAWWTALASSALWTWLNTSISAGEITPYNVHEQISAYLWALVIGIAFWWVVLTASYCILVGGLFVIWFATSAPAQAPGTSSSLPPNR